MPYELPGAFQDTMRLGLSCDIHSIMVHDCIEQGQIEGTARILGVEDLCTEDAVVFRAWRPTFDDIGWLCLSCYAMPRDGFADGSTQHMSQRSLHRVIGPDHQVLLCLLLEQMNIVDRPVLLAWKDRDPDLLHHVLFGDDRQWLRMLTGPGMLPPGRIKNLERQVGLQRRLHCSGLGRGRMETGEESVHIMLQP